jgi:PRC-barrel domain
MAEPKASARPAGVAPPALTEALEWIGFRVDDMNGSRLAKLEGLFVDVRSGEPVWAIVKLGRFGKVTAVPFGDCADGPGRIWVAHGREAVRGAPSVNPREPLTREREVELYDHYLIRPDRGRHEDIAGRKEGSVTAKPASAGEEV